MCCVAFALSLMAAPGVVQAQFFSDSFDSYAAGSTIAGQGGWETWANDPTANAVVVNSHSSSPPNSLDVSGTADIVHQFAGLTTGRWIFKTQTYLPSSQQGDLFLVILNRYDGAGCMGTGCNWSVQLDLCQSGCTVLGVNPGFATSMGGTDFPGTGSTPLVTDRWVEVEIEIDLDANQYSIWYNNVLLDTLPWTATGDINIGAINVFSFASSESYIDDVVLDMDLSIIHYWPFDGNTLDLAGGAHGTFIGSPAYVPGAAGDGLLFNGVSDAVSAVVDINPAMLPAMTMGAWVRVNNDTPIRQLISHDDGLYDRSLGIDDRGPGGTGWSAFAGSSGVMGGSVAASIGQYMLVAVSYDQGANEAMLYVHGVAETSPTGMGAGFPFINIGRNPYQGGIEYFSGVIDEVFISDRALSVAELDQIRIGGRVPGDFPFFIDGFESGNTQFWSATVP